MNTAATFIVHGAHISENLQHHKQSDVRRILEDKGFREDNERSTDEALHFVAETGGAGSGATTAIRFDDRGFVLEEGVAHE